MKTNYGKKQNVYMDTDSFLVYIKTENIYADIAKNIEARFTIERRLPKGKKEKVIRLKKDELGVNK